jgi:hypothetical protein
MEGPPTKEFITMHINQYTISLGADAQFDLCMAGFRLTDRSALRGHCSRDVVVRRNGCSATLGRLMLTVDGRGRDGRHHAQEQSGECLNRNHVERCCGMVSVSFGKDERCSGGFGWYRSEDVDKSAQYALPYIVSSHA